VGCREFRGNHDPAFQIRGATFRARGSAPALTSFANSSPAPFVAGVKAVRERITARTDNDRETFLRKSGFSKSETAKIIETVLGEENRERESILC
jgi:hypothetical protein